jgi:hypothetical protein
MNRLAGASRRRQRDLVFAIFLLLFGAYGLWVDHLHRLGEDAAGVHLHDVPAPILCAAMICASFVMIAALFDDYCADRSSPIGSPSAELGKWVGCTLLAVAIAGSSLG